MTRDSFMLQILKGSGTVSFRLNNTILPTLYALLKLECDCPHSQTWFELRFKFYNNEFVCSIKHLLYQMFRHRFLNIERHNERYEEHFFNDFLGLTHCTTSCDICIEHDSIHFSWINLELSCFKANYFDTEADNSIFYHKYTISCMLPIVKKQHLYSVSFQSMLIYAYYNNLTPSDKTLFIKSHTYHNNLFNDVLKILKEKLERLI